MAVVLLSVSGTGREAEGCVWGEELHQDFRIRAQESWVGMNDEAM